MDLAVSFVMASGLDLVFDALADVLVGRDEDRRTRLRILTSDYLDVTEPRALRRLMLLVERGAEVRVHEAAEESFHPKAYLFLRFADGRFADGSAFIGSSNLSRSGLLDGIEWNYRVDASSGDPPEVQERLLGIRGAFEALFHAPRAKPLTYEWIESYEARRPDLVRRVALVPEEALPPPPTPHEVQREALDALQATRAAGYRRGLVVMATGLGKTWLAAFDAARMEEASRVLFVAHREEILFQAEETFQRILPDRRIGQYRGNLRDPDAELLFASIQTLGKDAHLERFASDHFDYIVVDEFHHAAAPTYKRLLRHFDPRFLLGLTATPDRTDQSDILSFCDDNLVYSCDLVEGIRRGLLSPFRYYGIHDSAVDYREIPWRSGRFDPAVLENRLATQARFRHALRVWKEKGGLRTLAFCVSRKHADFMAERFRGEGVAAAAVHGTSELDRSEGLEQLARGELQVLFSVDLFNEGVDVPSVDTILMLRPTESKVLFLQQLGRGLRREAQKEFVTVLDFIGNHRSFLSKPQALFGIAATYAAAARFARDVEAERLELPPGCFVNYDLEILEFLKALEGDTPDRVYEALRDSLGRRPTAAEFHRAGGDGRRMRASHGHWWALVRAQGDLDEGEESCVTRHERFLREVETTSMTKSFKMVLLDTMLAHGGFRKPPKVSELSAWALEEFRRRRHLTEDLAANVRDVDRVDLRTWSAYWKKNPINAWIGGNRGPDAEGWFRVEGDRFQPEFEVSAEEEETFSALVQELVDYRLAEYSDRPTVEWDERGVVELPYVPDLDSAVRFFLGKQSAEETRRVPERPDFLDPSRQLLVPVEAMPPEGQPADPTEGGFVLLERLEGSEDLDRDEPVLIGRSSNGGTDYHIGRPDPSQSRTPLHRPLRGEYGVPEGGGELRALARLRGRIAAAV